MLSKILIKGCEYLLILIFCIVILINKLSGQENKVMTFPVEKSVSLSDDLNISYFQEGTGESVVIFIHGLGSNKKAWTNVMPHLSDQHTLFAIDLPKYLDSDDVSKIGMKHYSECVLLFMDKLNIQNATICGHSMGGQIATHFALSNPNRTEKLILLAPAGLEAFNDDDKKWFETYVTKAFYLSQSDSQIARNFDINFYGDTIPESASFMLDERLALKENKVRYEKYAAYIIACIQSMLSEPVVSLLPQLKTETLVVFGQNDRLIPNTILHSNLSVDDVLEVATQIPKVKTLKLDRAGHFIQWDRPKELSDIITQFILS